MYVSLAFLFGIAAQFRAMDGESLLRRILSIFARRAGPLYAVVIVTSLFSPLILNDVVILILTPVLVKYAKDFGADIAPLLIAEITFTNIASSLTPLGNPQNILLWNASGLDFLHFVEGTWFPLLLSGGIATLAIFPLRKRIAGRMEVPSGTSVPSGVYLCLIMVALLMSDLFSLPVYSTLGAGFFLGFLFTFRSSRGVLKAFDLRSLLTLYLFVGLITVISLLIGPDLGRFTSPVAQGIQPYSGLFMGRVSAAISNVPATQLVLSTSSIAPFVAPKIAVEAGLAGNIDPVSSFANILALLIVRRAGLPIGKTIILQLVVGAVAFLPALI